MPLTNWRAFRKTRRRQTDLDRAKDASPGGFLPSFRPAARRINRAVAILSRVRRDGHEVVATEG